MKQNHPRNIFAVMAVLASIGIARAEPAAPTAEAEAYSRGWCDGMLGANAMLQQRFKSWVQTIMVGRTLDDLKKTEMGTAISVLVDGVASYVLIGPPPTGETKLGNGKIVNCVETPKGE